MKRYDVVSICNALMDILMQVDEQDITQLGLNKGVMHLVDSNRQQELFQYFKERPHAQELGGSSMNAIRTLAQLGAKTVFAGMVGGDDFGKRIQDRMEKIGIVAKLKVSEEPTGSCAVLITPDGERTMNTNLGASRLFDEALVPKDEIADAKIFHYCGYQWDTDGQMRALRNAVEWAKKNDTIVSFDVSDPFVVTRHREEFAQMIKQDADIVFANEEESKLLYSGTPEKAADEITKSGAIAVIKLGAKGALIAKDGERIHIGPEKANVIDTTGAGDMFAAGFLYGFYRRKPLAACGKMAAILAADVIGQIGARVTDDALDAAARV